ncbi:MAG: phosphoribosylglycinamide formyltransferase [Actinomycetota bacterium]
MKFGILVSGHGSVLKTVLREFASGYLDGSVAAVGSNRECPGLDVARSAGVPAVSALFASDYESRSARDAALGVFLRSAGVDLVIVGGYNEPLEPSFFESIVVDVIGMYPSLLPAFGELPEAIGPALEYGVKTIGVTIHFRTPLTGSGGAIIAQEPLPVDIDDTVEGVTARVVALEGQFLPRVLRAFTDGRVAREGTRVRVIPAPVGSA